MKKILFILVVCLAVGAVSAQEEEVPLPKSLAYKQYKKNGEKRKFDFIAGGYFGLQIGNLTSIDVSPHFGICPVDFLCIGIGGTYMFANYHDSYYAINTQSHIFGGNAYIEGYIWDRLVIHAEYEFLSFPQQDKTRLNSHALLVGAGYQQQITEMIYIYGHILFPAYSTEKVYPLANYRLGINVKF